MALIKRDPASIPVEFINSAEKLFSLQAAIDNSVRIAVDTETHNARIVNGMWAALRVVSVALKMPDDTYKAFVVDFRDTPAKDLAAVMRSIKQADAWNANFDDPICRLNGVQVSKWRDAMLTDALLNSGVTGFRWWHSLSKAVKVHLGLEMSGKGTTQTSYNGVDDLSDEQIRYAGHDAILTLWVAERLDELAEEAGLTTAINIDQAARPFIQMMMEYGFPFQAADWKEFLKSHELKAKSALKTLTDLTGGGEFTLFGESEEPTWNPNSDLDCRKIFNKWVPNLVKAVTGGTELDKTTKFDKTLLKQMVQASEASTSDLLKEQAKLAAALLDYRTHTKVLSTYGDNILQFVQSDGRMRPQYKQALTATGRLASDKPNAQNLSPDMKPYMRPDAPEENKEERVFVHGDLSQAELRVLADLAGEVSMIDMFTKGGDFHAATAGQMFNQDMDALLKSSPYEYSVFRKKAKGVNFGIPYGLGAAALAISLTVNSGLKTERQEAQMMLDTYASTYTRVDAWLKERDHFIKSLAADKKPVDWESSFRLFDLWATAEPKRRTLKRELGHEPTSLELAEAIQPEASLSSMLESKLGRAPSLEEVASERELQTDALAWAFSFDAPIVLQADGAPLAFESRTRSGRRRLFTIPMDSTTTDKFVGVVTSAMLVIATTNKEAPARLRDEFAAEFGLDLPEGVNRCVKLPSEDAKAFRARSNEFRKTERMRCVKAFEGINKPLKALFVKTIIEKMGPNAGTYLLETALGDQITMMGNQFRNAPIQAGVSDVVLQAYADIFERIKKYRDCWPVQSVHDSIVLECYISEAVAVAKELKEALENAMKFWNPNVAAKADTDIRRSMHDDDVLSDEEVATLLSV